MCASWTSRAGYYAWRARKPSARARDDISLTSLIRTLFAGARNNPGVRRMRAMLAAAGRVVSHRKVHRLMRAAGLAGRHPQRFRTTTMAGQRPAPAPDLTRLHRPGRRHSLVRRHHLLQTFTGWACPTRRKVVGFAVADHMHTSLTDALSITHRQPERGVIFHSDRGSQYTSHAFDAPLARCGDGHPGICYDRRPVPRTRKN